MLNKNCWRNVKIGAPVPDFSHKLTSDHKIVRDDYTSSDMTLPGQTWLYLVKHDYIWSDMTKPETDVIKFNML